jgi:hypothetical protein
MKEEEIEKMLKELEEIRKSYRSKTLTAVRPTGSASMISSGAVSMDFTSLYANVQKSYNIRTPELRSFQRKVKIKKIFNL